MRHTILLIIWLSCITTVSAQEFYVFQGTCPSTALSWHKNQSTDETLVIVVELCGNEELRTAITVPEDGYLNEVMSFDNEGANFIQSVENGFYLLSQTDTNSILRLINDDLEVESEVEVALPESAWNIGMFVSNVLLTAYQEGTTLLLETFDLQTGESLETISFDNTPISSPYQSSQFINLGSYLYFGIACGYILEIDIVNLSNSALLPLPYSEELDTTYIPCSGISDLLRYNPHPDFLFSAASSIIEEEYIAFNFDQSGQHVGSSSFLFPPHYIPAEFQFDTEGNRYILFVTNFPDTVSGLKSDLVITKYSPDSNLIDSVHFQTPNWYERGHSVFLENSFLHLCGRKNATGNITDDRASYIRIDIDNMINVEESESQEYTFIQTENTFGIRTNDTPLKQEIYSTTGELLFTRKRSDLWSKSALPPGTYVLKVVTDHGRSSHLVVVR